MNSYRIILATAAFVLVAAAAQALDNIKTNTGTNISGKNLRINWDNVEIEYGLTGNVKKVPVNQIVVIFFDNEPSLLKNAKQAITSDRNYRDALTTLAKIKPDDLDSDELKQDYEFYLALCNAKLALEGTGRVKDAGKSMLEFVKKKENQKSYHFLEACEVLGDLLVAVRSYGPAEEYYKKLDAAPWPDTKMKAGVLIGRAQLAQNKFAEANQSFQAVIDNDAEGLPAESQRLAATLGKASVLAGQKKGKEAIALIKDLIEKGDSEDALLMSRAYNALGNAYRQMGDLQEAKLAFLHTDQLYSSVPDAHAEALANLAEIWEQLHKTDRAVEAKKTLLKLYKNSPWAKKAE